MKFFILLVFSFGVKAQVLKVGMTALTGTNEIIETIGPIATCDNLGGNKEKVSKYARKYGIGLYDNEEAVTNKNNLVKPCPENDYDCMREFMANNSQCKPVYGPVPDPICLAQFTVYLAFSNMTLTYINSTITGLGDASISSFFYDTVTEALVVVIKVPVLTVKVPKLYISYKRPGQEPLVKSDCANVTFKSLTFTAIIPKIKNLRLDLADILFGYSGEKCPDYYVGPKAYTSKDPIVRAEYEEFLANMPLAVRSFFLFKSEIFAALFIQKFICDFNIDVYSS